MWQHLFGSSQRLALLGIRHFRRIRSHDVLVSNAARVDSTLTRLYPIPSLTERVIPDASTNIEPLGHLLRLANAGVDSVLVSEVEHTSILACLERYNLLSRQNLSVKFINSVGDSSHTLRLALKVLEGDALNTFFAAHRYRGRITRPLKVIPDDWAGAPLPTALIPRVR